MSAPAVRARRAIESAACLAVLIVALLAGAGARRTPPPPHPDPWSTARAGRIDRLLQRYVDGDRIAGAVALVLRDGAPVYERAIGWSDREAGRPMTADAVFRIASQTKAVTSVAILSLMEEGRLALDDPAARFIPGFAHTTVAVRHADGSVLEPAERPITIRQLLTHTAGISYGTRADIADRYAAQGLGPAAGEAWYTADKLEPICDTMERLAGLPIVAQPGTAWVYGYNTDVLGCIAERASGVPLDRLIRERVTGPLGMNDTAFFLPPGARDRLTAVYASGPGGRIVRAPDGAKGQGAYVDGPRRSFSGGAGLLSTARDYARFLEMIRRGGALDGARILRPATVALMATNQVGTLYSPDGLGFGLGFETTDRAGAKGPDPVGSYGWGGAYGSLYRVDPRDRLVFVLMIQLLPDRTDIREAFAAAVYGALGDGW